MEHIINIISDEERAFYGSKDKEFQNITISGPKDGESAFKECKNISVKDSVFNLRYPFWHNDNLSVSCSNFSNTCRAPFWYTNNVTFSSSFLYGPKSFRECNNILIENCFIDSDEFSWRNNKIIVKSGKIVANYAFFQCNDVKINNLRLNGKYSFQYVDGLQIDASFLETKDAFWHSKNAVIKDSIINGEYLGWYSENLTLINCHIKGTQPLCYCKGLKLINCTFDEADFAFEYSEVEGNVLGPMISIKNPLKGRLEITGQTELIQDENDKSNGNFILKFKNL